MKVHKVTAQSLEVEPKRRSFCLLLGSRKRLRTMVSIYVGEKLECVAPGKLAGCKLGLLCLNNALL